MRMTHRGSGARFVAVGAAILFGAGLLSCKGEPTSPSTSLVPSISATGQQAQEAGLAKAMQAKDKYAAQLMSRPDVVGAAVGLTTDGHPAVLVLAAAAPGPGLPKTLDGVPVRVLITGPIRAIPPAVPAAKGGVPGPPSKNGGSSGSTSSLTTTDMWPRPVPIGISTGNAGQCEAGTISARLKDGSGNYYALSNNHVFALENDAAIGSQIMQPGLYDTQCLYSSSDDLGTLAGYIPIDFSGGTNTVDAALALMPNDHSLGDSTPPDGYGTPSSTLASASVGLAVQKYGRSTQDTHGQVTGINATISVGYSTGTAVFDHQIIVQSHKPFIKAGDSGSLVVTDDGSNDPVGLIFAGDNSGKYAIANDINLVLPALRSHFNDNSLSFYNTVK